MHALKAIPRVEEQVWTSLFAKALMAEQPNVSPELAQQLAAHARSVLTLFPPRLALSIYLQTMKDRRDGLV